MNQLRSGPFLMAPKLLGNALGCDYTPGSDLPGDLGECDWRFLLPQLSFENTICFGSMSPTVLKLISQFSGHVLSIAFDQESGAAPSGDVVLIDSTEWRNIAAKESADFIYVACADDLRKLAHNRMVLRDALALLKPGGVLFSELYARNGRKTRILFQELERADLGSWEELELNPWSSRFRSAAPVAERFVIAHCRSLCPSPPLRKSMPFGVRTLPPRNRRAIVAQRGRKGSGGVPDYLEAVANRAGVSLEGYRWGLVAGTPPPLKNTVFLLFTPGCTKPEVIAKVARQPSFNRRLENEFYSLQALLALGAPEAKVAPRPLFLGSEAGLAVSAQTAIEGRPLGEVPGLRPDSAPVRAVVDWLVSLAWKTAWRVDGAEIAASLSSLADRFYHTYSSPAEEREFLANQLAVVSGYRRFPVVFQHGDPHTGNVLITNDDRLAVLDWESADPAGMPAWDLFCFLHAIARLAAGARESESAVFQNFFLAGTGWRALMQSAVAAYCDVLQLDRCLMEPLFFTCWLHRALKEATGLPVMRAGKGNAIELLRCAMAHSRDPGFRGLFQ